MKTLADLILSAGERARLEYDGLRYRALINAIEAGEYEVRPRQHFITPFAARYAAAGLDKWLDERLNRGD